MKKSVRGQLRDAIREIVAAKGANNQTTPDVVDVLIETHRRLVEVESDRLIRASLAHEVREVIRSQNLGDQYIIPLLEDIPDLPKLIPLRIGKKNGPVTWISTREANLNQIDLCIRQLKKPLGRNKVISALEELKEQVMQKDVEYSGEETIDELLADRSAKMKLL